MRRRISRDAKCRSSADRYFATSVSMLHTKNFFLLFVWSHGRSHTRILHIALHYWNIGALASVRRTWCFLHTFDGFAF